MEDAKNGGNGTKGREMCPCGCGSCGCERGGWCGGGWGGRGSLLRAALVILVVLAAFLVGVCVGKFRNEHRFYGYPMMRGYGYPTPMMYGSGYGAAPAATSSVN